MWNLDEDELFIMLFLNLELRPEPVPEPGPDSGPSEEEYFARGEEKEAKSRKSSSSARVAC